MCPLHCLTTISWAIEQYGAQEALFTVAVPALLSLLLTFESPKDEESLGNECSAHEVQAQCLLALVELN